MCFEKKRKAVKEMAITKKWEGIVKEIGNRLSAIETQLGDIRASLRWMVGIQISMLLVLIGLLLNTL